MATTIAMGSTDLSNTRVTSYNIPLSAISSWPPANLINPQTRSWLVSFSFILQLFTTIIVAARLWFRYFCPLVRGSYLVLINDTE